MYRKFADAVKVPVLANITEFGADAAVHASRSCARPASAIVLYPLSAFRAMNKAALKVYETRAPRRHAEDRGRRRCRRATELYDFLGYHAYEQKLDALFCANGEAGDA